jgi:hypothetical protein
MECSLPPERAGRAPQASRHSNTAEVAIGAAGVEAIGPDGGIIVRPASVGPVAAGFGLEGGLGLVVCAESESMTVLCEQAQTVAAKPTPPASQSS